ncbi:MAG: hypothetical protein DMD48_00935 [Gemmatimonadetes bacterium]|nr:MAG: hypothetical protein DMD48_00935 [Gemmatimonadota bacterium]
MPSLEQLQHEELAHAVERATARLPFFAAHERLWARVLTKDGLDGEMQVLDVDLDGGLLKGLDRHGAPTQVDLSSVAAVWQRRPRVGRSVLIWLSATLTGAGAGVLIAPGAPLSPIGGVLGALGGLMFGALLSWLVEDREAMYEWKQFYGPAA